jgi:hypothetical protein
VRRYAAAALPDFVKFAQEMGWDVGVIATPDGMKFLDAARLADMTGYPVRSQYKQPDEPDVLPPADALVVAPTSFNTINIWAHGISDTLALGLLNEATGLGLPIVAARARYLCAATRRVEQLQERDDDAGSRQRARGHALGAGRVARAVVSLGDDGHVRVDRVPPASRVIVQVDYPLRRADL